MNTLRSSSRAIGNTSTTASERCTRLDTRFTEMSYEQPHQSTHSPNNISRYDVDESPRRTDATSNQGMPNVSGSHPSASSGKARSKRKSSYDATVHAVITNFQSCVAELGHTMVDYADRITSKEVPRPCQYIVELFDAAESLDLPHAYLFEEY